MSLIIGGDFVVTPSNEYMFSEGNIADLFDEELKRLFLHSSKTIFNLEAPLTNHLEKIMKNGPCLKIAPSAINGFKELNIGAFSLANNHIMDYGDVGLFETEHVLAQNQFDYFGAGANLKEASEAYIFEFLGKKIGIVSCTEKEFSCATITSPGANGYNPYKTPIDVSELKQKSDYVIVLYHGGKEEYRYPAPYLVEICHELVDHGADLVLCQHSHCIGCEEEYGSGRILYGQGNFLFDYSNKETWKSGLLVLIDEKFKVSYLPIVKNKNGCRTANNEESNLIMSEFFFRSKEIKDDNFINKAYEQLSNDYIDSYLAAMARPFLRSVKYRLLQKLLGEGYIKKVVSRKYDSSDRVIIENYINCEAHRDLFVKGLQNDNR